MGSIRSLPCLLLVLAVLVSACTSKPKPGDACRASPNETVCADSASLGSCRAFTWHVDPCRGPGGCSSGVCDQSVAAENDSCSVEGARVCSTNGADLLRCDAGTMVVERTCRGERGCYRASPNVPPACDPGPAQVGDACTGSGGSRCSADGKTILQCSHHHMIIERECHGPKGCFPNPHFHQNGWEYLACDIAAGDIGQPCIGYAGVGTRIEEGGTYCSTDGSELLTCKHGVLVSKSECPCSVTWAADLAAYSVGCDVPATGGGRARTVRSGSAAFLSLAERP